MCRSALELLPCQSPSDHGIATPLTPDMFPLRQKKNCLVFIPPATAPLTHVHLPQTRERISYPAISKPRRSRAQLSKRTNSADEIKWAKILGLENVGPCATFVAYNNTPSFSIKADRFLERQLDSPTKALLSSNLLSQSQPLSNLNHGRLRC